MSKFKLYTIIMLSALIFSLSTTAASAQAATVRKVSKLKGISKSTKTIKLSWKKVSGCKYKVAYSTSKKQLAKEKNGVCKKIKNVKLISTSKTSYTLKKLASKKKYYVKVCAFKKKKSKLTYGKWSAVIGLYPNGSKKTVTNTSSNTAATDSSGKISITQTNATIYAMNSYAAKFISIPSSFPQKSQIQVKGADKVTYSTPKTTSVTVDANGLVTPKKTIYYWSGSIGSTSYNANADYTTTQYSYETTPITVTADGKKFTINVTLSNYTECYANQVIDKYIKTTVSPCKTNYEKLEAICKFVASYDYSASYSSYVSMIVAGGGDCVASTSTIITMCRKIGLTAYSRNASMDGGAGSGHRNAVVEFGGKYYIAEAGYEGNAPRYWDITEYDSPFTIYTNSSNEASIGSYFGQDKNVVVPDTYKGYPVTKISDKAFFTRSDITSITLPSSIRTIEEYAFFGCRSLTALQIPAATTTIADTALVDLESVKNLTVESGNKSFICENGILYDIDKTTVIASSLSTTPNVILPDSVKVINKYAFYENKSLTSITLGSQVDTIGDYAFAYCYSLQQVILNNGLKSIGDYAFAQALKLKQITIPSTTTVSDSAFKYCDGLQIIH